MEDYLYNERQSLNSASGRKTSPNPPKEKVPPADIEELKKKADAERS